jgi:hypothetical protein
VIRGRRSGNKTGGEVKAKSVQAAGVLFTDGDLEWAFIRFTSRWMDASAESGVRRIASEVVLRDEYRDLLGETVVGLAQVSPAVGKHKTRSGLCRHEARRDGIKCEARATRYADNISILIGPVDFP